MQQKSIPRQQVYQEIEEMFGLVPSMFKEMPDSSLEMEWRLFKKVQFDPGPIPNKYRELIGVALAAATKCRYCEVYHTELARLKRRHGRRDRGCGALRQIQHRLEYLHQWPADRLRHLQG